MSYGYFCQSVSDIQARNRADNLPQLNSLPLLLTYNESMSQEIQKALIEMIASGYDRRMVDVFLVAYKRPLAHIRKDILELTFRQGSEPHPDRCHTDKEEHARGSATPKNKGRSKSANQGNDKQAHLFS